MSKKLVIKFWKAERALAMQILEQEGLPEEKADGVVCIVSSPAMFEDEIYLRGDYHRGDFNISGVSFKTNSKRDAYLDNVIKSITDELFTSNCELKIGETCKVSDNENEDGAPNELIAILQKGYKSRFIVKVFYGTGWESFEYARPLSKRTEPKVETNGEIITCTWEEE